MQCAQFEQLLEQESDESLPEAAALHLENCSDCCLLWDDIQAIRRAGRELGAEEPTPALHLWPALRARLESEGLVRDVKPAGWFRWTPRLAFVGASMAALFVAISLVSYERDRATVPVPVTQDSAFSPAPLVAGVASALDGDVKRVMASLPEGNLALTESFQQNLGIVDNLIAMCERSVRELPDDPVVRKYLYGAYQQKAVLLAAAMDRSTLEDR